jgi:hypothetical protein
VKAPHGDGWRTRWVSAFAPRAFSAIALPEATLGSRAVVVPLARTTDPARGHRDPADDAAWPHDRLALQDDLWALGLTWLPRAAEAWAALDAEDTIVGREYEKWRPILAVARLAEAAGVGGLGGRMRALMHAYQRERADLTTDDETLEVVRGLLRIAMELVVRVLPGLGPERIAGFAASEHVFTNAHILEAVAAVLPDSVLAGLPPRTAATRIGLIASRLRLRRSRGPAPDRERGWAISVDRAADLARAYGVPHHLSNLPELQSNLMGKADRSG